MTNNEELAFPASDGCPCIDSTKIFSPLSDCTTSAGFSGVKSTENSDICVPLDYGSSYCKQHDYLSNVLCQADSAGTPLPSYCFDTWCYVDYDKCILSNEIFFRSDSFARIEPNLFYSYSTCNSSATAWQEHVTTEALHKISNLKATIPIILSPLHYKLSVNKTVADASGSEYYNNSMPFQGALIDYMHKIDEYSDGIGGINFVFRSKGSDIKYPLSKFTASVRDVQIGISDMAVGPFWITAERMRMTSFTTPVTMDRTYLVVEQPEIDNSIRFQFKKLIMPFDPGLWSLLVGTIIAVGALSIWFSSPKAVNKRPWLAFRDDEWRESSWTRRGFIFYRQLIESVLDKGMEFFGGAVEHDFKSSLPHKLLMFGFAFLILISASAYVANLAAYLTLTGVSDYIDSMEVAISQNKRICVHPAIEGSVEKVWPDAIFYFSQRGTEFYGMLEDWDEGKCDILAVGWVDTRYDEQFLRQMCKRKLVFTEGLVVDMPIAFPVRNDLAAGISHWLLNAENNHGLMVDKMLNYHQPNLGNCNIDIVTDLNSEKDMFPSLTVRNMVFPFIFLALFAIMAIIVKLCDRRKTLLAAKWIAETANLEKNSARKLVDMINFAHLEMDDIESFSGYDSFAGDSESEEMEGSNANENGSLRQTKAKNNLMQHKEDDLDQVQSYRRRSNSNEDSMQYQQNQLDQMHRFPPRTGVQQQYKATNLGGARHENGKSDKAQRFRGKLTATLTSRFKDSNSNLTEFDEKLDVQKLFGKSIDQMQNKYTSSKVLRRSPRQTTEPTVPSWASNFSDNDGKLAGLIEYAVERSITRALEKREKG